MRAGCQNEVVRPFVTRLGRPKAWTDDAVVRLIVPREWDDTNMARITTSLCVGDCCRALFTDAHGSAKGSAYRLGIS